MPDPEAPRNLMALCSVVIGAFGIAAFCCVGTGVGPFIGLALGWLGMALGMLGWRHALQHGFGLPYARYGVALNVVSGGLYALICTWIVAALVFGSL